MVLSFCIYSHQARLRMGELQNRVVGLLAQLEMEAMVTSMAQRTTILESISGHQSAQMVTQAATHT